MIFLGDIWDIIPIIAYRTLTELGVVALCADQGRSVSRLLMRLSSSLGGGT